jgi:hypothetical protein
MLLFMPVIILEYNNVEIIYYVIRIHSGHFKNKNVFSYWNVLCGLNFVFSHPLRPAKVVCYYKERVESPEDCGQHNVGSCVNM